MFMIMTAINYYRSIEDKNLILLQLVMNNVTYGTYFEYIHRRQMSEQAILFMKCELAK